MGNKKTPLIQRLRDTGGTLVVFPSAAEDIGLNLQATTSGVAMSHYALLNIPELSMEKCVKECAKTIDCQGDPNLAMSMSLQNYIMNFETLLINQENYNYQALNTVSEKAFWHWAMHIGILDPAGLTNVTESYYKETAYDDDSSTLDNTVIKCFGSIDAGNQLSTEFGMFNETYITIPTSWGSGPVYLKSSYDDNYRKNYSYQLTDINRLEGRYDNYSYYTYTNGQDYPFFDSSVKYNGYYNVKGLDGLEIVKDVNEIQHVATAAYPGKNIILGSHDDINIDSENYFNIDSEFEFNAILLYYSVYDQDDMVKTAYATNLFGIIFVDGCRVNDTVNKTFIIPTLTKRKSSSAQFGNSFSFRVNLKTMSVYDNTDAIIQDNTTTAGVNATEFADAISNMNRAIDIMNTNMHTVLNIQDQYAAIITRYDDFRQDIDDLSTCINAYLRGTRSSFIDTSVVYTNDIKPSEKSTSNTINVYTRTGQSDGNGNIMYQPVINIHDNSIYMTNLYVESLHTDESYVNIKDTSVIDKAITVDDSNDQYITRANETIDDVFDASKLYIKVRETYSNIFNSIYIDYTSPIFTDETPDGKSLKYLVDPSGNINYIEMIPYIIAQLQKITATLNI